MGKTSVLIISAALVLLTSSVAAQEVDPVRSLMKDYSLTEGHFTVGLDTMNFGSIKRDKALGYPRSSIGGNLLLGVVWRNYFGQPDADEVREVAMKLHDRNPSLAEDDLRDEVKDEIDRRWFTYFGANTVLLVMPGVEAGFTYDMTDAEGTGASFNIGALWSLLSFFPVPTMGFQYSF